MSTENAAVLSFIGGRPFLPPEAEIPACAVCSAHMCFFFQIAFPVGHAWEGSLLGMFHCVSCSSESTLVPAMLSGPLRSAEIPQGFLTAYQTNFRIVVADVTSTKVRTDYAPLIEHTRISLASWRVGRRPKWLLEDETPGSYESHNEPTFLFQVPQGMTFPTRPGAPLQKTIDLEGQVVDDDRPYYELFLGNAIYAFGFGTPSAERVYVVTQVD